jgi:hypothetical protein
MTSDYICPECGDRLKNAPDYRGRGHAGHLVAVMACANCDKFFAQDPEGVIYEVEGIQEEL